MLTNYIMKKRQLIIIFTIVLSSYNTFGQNYEPLDLAKKIFSKEVLPNIENYTSGEYKGKPNGQDLQKGTTTKFFLLGQTEQTAVVAMTILDTTGIGLDAYLHFQKNTVWKMNAFRALAMTGFIKNIATVLQKMTPKQIDEIINKKNSERTEYEIFHSKEEYDFELGNTKLTIDLDDNIIKHFLANQTAFERLKNNALAQLKKEEIDNDRSTKLIVNLKAEYQKIFIASISTGGYELGNGINFLIGGMIDNTVGYLFVKDKKDLPAMNPSRIIMIREIGNGWYIYKTT